MSAQSLARGPDFLDVDEAGLQHVLGVAIFEASLLGAAGADHREDIHPRGETFSGGRPTVPITKINGFNPSFANGKP
jgi:hypothetical protein